MTQTEMRVALAKYSELHPEFPRWLTGGKADSGLSYCFACAETAKTALNDPEVILDGGWMQEEDGTCQCETCAILLEHRLTEHGIELEIWHFEKYGFSKPIDKSDAYAVAILLDSAPQNTKVLKIAELAVAAII